MVDIDWDSDTIQKELRSRLKHVMEYLEADSTRCASDTAAGTRCSRQRDGVEDVIQCWQHRP